MADVVFNIALGSVAEKVRAGANLIVVVLEAAEADGTLRDYDALDALLAAAGNTEWAATGYARVAVGNANATLTVDDAADTVNVDIPDWTWTAVSGNPSVKLLVCTDATTDAGRIPLTAHDFAVTPDGTDINVSVPNGIFGA